MVFSFNIQKSLEHKTNPNGGTNIIINTRSNHLTKIEVRRRILNEENLSYPTFKAWFCWFFFFFSFYYLPSLYIQKIVSTPKLKICDGNMQIFPFLCMENRAYQKSYVRLYIKVAPRKKTKGKLFFFVPGYLLRHTGRIFFMLMLNFLNEMKPKGNRAAMVRWCPLSGSSRTLGVRCHQMAQIFHQWPQTREGNTAQAHTIPLQKFMVSIKVPLLGSKTKNIRKTITFNV